MKEAIYLVNGTICSIYYILKYNFVKLINFPVTDEEWMLSAKRASLEHVRSLEVVQNVKIAASEIIEKLPESTWNPEALLNIIIKGVIGVVIGVTVTFFCKRILNFIFDKKVKVSGFWKVQSKKKITEDEILHIIFMSMITILLIIILFK